MTEPAGNQASDPQPLRTAPASTMSSLYNALQKTRQAKRADTVLAAMVSWIMREAPIFLRGFAKL